MIQKTREVTLRRIREIVGTAIKQGAPLYNEDQITDCAHIYSMTATALLRMLRKAASNEPTPRPFAIHAPSPREASFGNERLLASVVRTILQTEIEAAGELTVASSKDVAWALRYCFDEIIGFAHFIEKIDGAMQGVRASTQIAPVLSTALHAAETLHTTASKTGREWILACAGVFRYSATLLVPVLERDPTNRFAGRIANMFAIALKSDDTGPDANPYRSAWALLHAFLRAHKLVTR